MARRAAARACATIDGTQPQPHLMPERT
jgi:hypothetical protein